MNNNSKDKPNIIMNQNTFKGKVNSIKMKGTLFKYL